MKILKIIIKNDQIIEKCSKINEITYIIMKMLEISTNFRLKYPDFENNI